MTRGSFRNSPVDSSLARLERIGLIPDLAGAEVFVAGAMPGGTEDAVRVYNFWLKYFEDAGSSFSKGRYARHLHSFVE